MVLSSIQLKCWDDIQPVAVALSLEVHKTSIALALSGALNSW